MRGTITSDMWETLNATYLESLTFSATMPESARGEFLEWVKYRAHLTRGITSGTLLRDEALCFTHIGTFLERADAALLAAYHGVRSCAFGHVGDGNMHYNPVCPLGWDGARFRGERARINRLVHDIVVELGGAISAEHGIGRARLCELEHYKQPVELEMMRLIKRALDPNGIMNPGKVIRALGGAPSPDARQPLVRWRWPPAALRGA